MCAVCGEVSKRDVTAIISVNLHLNQFNTVMINDSINNFALELIEILLP